MATKQKSIKQKTMLNFDKVQLIYFSLPLVACSFDLGLKTHTGGGVIKTHAVPRL